MINAKKIFFFGKFYFFKKKRWFFGRFSAFYGQRSVTAAWATRSPWSIFKKDRNYNTYPSPGSRPSTSTSDFWTRVCQKFRGMVRGWILKKCFGSRRACVCHQWWRTKRSLPLFLPTFFSFFLRLLLFTHFGKTPVAENLFPQYFGITRRKI